MKFLVETELFPTAPTASIPDLLARTQAHVASERPDVIVDVVYGVAGRRGSVAICDAPDAASLHDVLARAPLFHHESIRVTALVPFGPALDAMAASAR